ncbi:Phosphoadenosine phosphosulfate reductase [Lasiodiplodia theobromae]|uniref:FAD synthase n=1 Tax=Lasiodiplodia theobromae TaxID=45133 RepID=A0A5N5DQE3_9PEZI|nr:Phosphoadenosine phosphosulfate reductase [Lasiodiplodia theobromae]KAB2579551.1 FAD synthase [Lasiodiplodia theobromae]KAF4542265.1 Phosphoadenosine phosphosulfate reductase [Lasiodiplodia theobromae]
MTGVANHVLKPQSQAPLVPVPPLSFPDLCARLDDRISAFLRDDDVKDARLRAVQEQTRSALGVIEDALQRYSSLDELALSYNGGKDCLVLLVLYLCALHRRSVSTATPLPETIQTVYIQSAHPFPEVEQFVAESCHAYSLTLATYSGSMKVAFESYLRDYPSVKAIFVGTRRTDPHGEHLKHFDPTDHGWPSFMRIHPVIDWHYVEIWTFIRHLDIPYCPLYDQGYTSLGGTTDTHPNPALRIPSPDSDSGSKDQKFRPAYELVEDYEERLGRDRGANSTKQSPKPSP